jgi:glycosyltransferase involved in cell wall biosynthesis
MGAGQRAQLFAVARSAQLVLGASEAWARLVTRSAHLARSARVAAVGSNLPDARGAREAERRRLEIGSGTVVLSHLSTPHPSRLAEHVVRAANGVVAAGLRVVLLNLGAHAPSLCGLDSRIAIRTPGRIEDAALARAIAASDIFLSPCTDGVSVRRTSLMAALQQGCCVVGTESPTTDAVLRGGELELMPVGDVEGFAQRVVGLAHDRERRARLAKGARRLHEQRFSWPVLAADLARDLRSVAPGP